MSDGAVQDTTGGEAFILAEGVRHVYKGGTVALDGVDLSIGTGLFGLLGPNGAGKSTLMRIICTLLVPTEGRVLVGGHDVIGDRRGARRLFGYLPQEFGAWPPSPVSTTERRARGGWPRCWRASGCTTWPTAR